MIIANTACCKTVTVGLISPDAFVGQSLVDAITVSVDYQPLFDLSVSLTISSATNTSMSVHDKLLLVPSISQTFESRVGGPAISTTLLQGESRTYSIALSLLSQDEYHITAVLQGRSENEFQVQYQLLHSTVANLVLNVKSPQQLMVSQQRVAAPRAVSASFSDDGSVVQIQFDRATNRGSYVNGFDCKRLLQFKGYQRANCRWRNDAIIEIGFPTTPFNSNTLLAINDTVVLRNDASIRVPCLQAGNESTETGTLPCRLANSSIVTSLIVRRPTNPFVPIVLLSAPAEITPCSLLRLDVSGSVGSGGRDWQSYRFVVRNSRSFGMESFEEFLHSPSYKLIPATPIPSSFLLPNSAYFIELTLCNFLSACGKSSVTVRVTNLTTPAFALYLLGMSQLTILPKNELRVQTQPLVTACNGSNGDFATSIAANAVYVWQVMFANGSVLNTIRSRSVDPLVFYLPSFVLRPDMEYIIKGSASISVRSTVLSAQTSVRVTVINDVLVATLGGNVAKSLLVGQSMRLDASGSTDSNLPRGLSGIAAGLRVFWSCYHLNPLANQSSSCPLLLSGWRTGSMTASAAATAFVTGRSESANATAISSALVNTPNVTARVVISVSSGTRIASTFVDITVTSLFVRNNFISMKLLQDGDQRLFNVQQKLSILGTIDLYKPCNASWSVDDPSISLRQISLTPLHKMLQVSSTVASGSMTIERLYLSLASNSLPGDSSFIFRLKCGDSMEGIQVDTNSPPRPGAFLASPGKGIALSTLFQLLAVRWTDQQLPLKYEFRYWAYTTQSYVTLRSFQAVGELTTVLPLGLESNLFQVPLQLSVSDTLNAVSQASANVSVQGIVNVSHSVRYAAEIVESLDARDVETTKQKLSLVGMIILQANCSQTVHSCSSFNREPCSTISQTCGACLVGYVGEAGSANSPCTLVSTALVASNDNRYLSNLQFVTQNIFRHSLMRDTSPGSLEQYEIPDISLSKFTTENRRTIFNSIRRSLQSSNDSSDEVKKVPCRLTSDCLSVAGIDSPWIYCNRRTRLCSVRSKVCHGSCSFQGTCVFRDLNSGASLHDCSTGDPQCEAVCQCEEGYFGESCDLTLPIWISLRRFTSLAISALYSTSQSEVTSLQSVSVWTQLLKSLTFKPDRLDRSDIQRALLLVGSILTYFEKLQADATLALPESVSGRQVDAAAALASSDLTTLQQLLEILDNLASRWLVWEDLPESTWNTSYSNMSTSMFAPTLNNSLVQSRGLLTLVQRQQNILRRYQVIGETSSLVILRNLRVTLHAVQTQRGGTENISSPISPDEALADVLDPFGSRPARDLQNTMTLVWRTAADSTLTAPIADALRNVSNADIVISLVEFRASQYQNHRVLRNNPVLVQINFVSSPQEMLAFLLPSSGSSTSGFRNLALEDVRAALAESVTAIRWKVPHFQRVLDYAEDFVVRNLTSICYGPGDFSLYEMQCADSGMFLRHNCSEKHGQLVSFCPKAISSCSHLSSVVSQPLFISFANESLEETKLEKYSSLGPLCQLTSYSEYETVCQCDMESGLAANRSAQNYLEDFRYAYGIDDEADEVTAPTPVTFLLSGDRSTEISLVNEYEPYRFADFFEETRIDPEFPAPWASLALFAPAWLLLLMIGVTWQRFQYQRMVVNKGKGADARKVGVHPFVVSASSGFSTESSREDASKPDDVFVTYLSLISALLPDVFQRAPLFTVVSNPNVPYQVSQATVVLWKHHRYLQLLRELVPSFFRCGNNYHGNDRVVDDNQLHEELLAWLDVFPTSSRLPISSGATLHSSAYGTASSTKSYSRSVRDMWRRSKLSLSMFTALMGTLTVIVILLDAQLHGNESICQENTPLVSSHSFTLAQVGNWSSMNISDHLASSLDHAKQNCLGVRSFMDDGISRCTWQIYPDPVYILRPTELQPLTLHFECAPETDPAKALSIFSLFQVVIIAIATLVIVQWVSDEVFRQVFSAQWLPTDLRPGKGVSDRLWSSTLLLRRKRLATSFNPLLRQLNREYDDEYGNEESAGLRVSRYSALDREDENDDEDGDEDEDEVEEGNEDEQDKNSDTNKDEDNLSPDAPTFQGYSSIADKNKRSRRQESKMEKNPLTSEQRLQLHCDETCDTWLGLQRASEARDVAEAPPYSAADDLQRQSGKIVKRLRTLREEVEQDKRVMEVKEEMLAEIDSSLKQLQRHWARPLSIAEQNALCNRAIRANKDVLRLRKRLLGRLRHLALPLGDRALELPLQLLRDLLRPSVCPAAVIDDGAGAETDGKITTPSRNHTPSVASGNREQANKERKKKKVVDDGEWVMGLLEAQLAEEHPVLKRAPRWQVKLSLLIWTLVLGGCGLILVYLIWFKHSNRASAVWQASVSLVFLTVILLDAFCLAPFQTLVGHFWFPILASPALRQALRRMILGSVTALQRMQCALIEHQIKEELARRRQEILTPAFGVNFRASLLQNNPNDLQKQSSSGASGSPVVMYLPSELELLLRSQQNRVLAPLSTVLLGDFSPGMRLNAAQKMALEIQLLFRHDFVYHTLQLRVKQQKLEEKLKKRLLQKQQVLDHIHSNESPNAEPVAASGDENANSAEELRIPSNISVSMKNFFEEEVEVNEASRDKRNAPDKSDTDIIGVICPEPEVFLVRCFHEVVPPPLLSSAPISKAQGTSEEIDDATDWLILDADEPSLFHWLWSRCLSEWHATVSSPQDNTAADVTGERRKSTRGSISKKSRSLSISPLPNLDEESDSDDEIDIDGEDKGGNGEDDGEFCGPELRTLSFMLRLFRIFFWLLPVEVLYRLLTRPMFRSVLGLLRSRWIRWDRYNLSLLSMLLCLFSVVLTLQSLLWLALRLLPHYFTFLPKTSASLTSSIIIVTVLGTLGMLLQSCLLFSLVVADHGSRFLAALALRYESPMRFTDWEQLVAAALAKQTTDESVDIPATMKNNTKTGALFLNLQRKSTPPKRSSTVENRRNSLRMIKPQVPWTSQVIVTSDSVADFLPKFLLLIVHNASSECDRRILGMRILRRLSQLHRLRVRKHPRHCAVTNGLVTETEEEEDDEVQKQMLLQSAMREFAIRLFRNQTTNGDGKTKANAKVDAINEVDDIHVMEAGLTERIRRAQEEDALAWTLFQQLRSRTLLRRSRLPIDKAALLVQLWRQVVQQAESATDDASEEEEEAKRRQEALARGQRKSMFQSFWQSVSGTGNSMKNKLAPNEPSASLQTQESRQISAARRDSSLMLPKNDNDSNSHDNKSNSILGSIERRATSFARSILPVSSSTKAPSSTDNSDLHASHDTDADDDKYTSDVKSVKTRRATSLSSMMSLFQGKRRVNDDDDDDDDGETDEEGDTAMTIGNGDAAARRRSILMRANSIVAGEQSSDSTSADCNRKSQKKKSVRLWLPVEEVGPRGHASVLIFPGRDGNIIDFASEHSPSHVQSSNHILEAIAAAREIVEAMEPSNQSEPTAAVAMPLVKDLLVHDGENKEEPIAHGAESGRTQEETPVITTPVPVRLPSSPAPMPVLPLLNPAAPLRPMSGNIGVSSDWSASLLRSLPVTGPAADAGVGAESPIRPMSARSALPMVQQLQTQGWLNAPLLSLTPNADAIKRPMSTNSIRKPNWTTGGTPGRRTRNFNVSDTANASATAGVHLDNAEGSMGTGRLQSGSFLEDDDGDVVASPVASPAAVPVRQRSPMMRSLSPSRRRHQHPQHGNFAPPVHTPSRLLMPPEMGMVPSSSQRLHYGADDDDDDDDDNLSQTSGISFMRFGDDLRVPVRPLPSLGGSSSSRTRQPAFKRTLSPLRHQDAMSEDRPPRRHHQQQQHHSRASHTSSPSRNAGQAHSGADDKRPNRTLLIDVDEDDDTNSAVSDNEEKASTVPTHPVHVAVNDTTRIRGEASTEMEEPSRLRYNRAAAAAAYLPRQNRSMRIPPSSDGARVSSVNAPSTDANHH
jgi:hypothetical protein